MPFFSKVFGRNKDASSASAKSKAQSARNGPSPAPPPPQHPPEDAWERKQVSADHVYELLHFCNLEMKTRDLDMPFLLLPFRPNADPSAARNFIRTFFRGLHEGSPQSQGSGLQHELRLLEPMVLCSIMKWAWSRLPGGVIGWNTYNLFKSGEKESNMAKHAFDTFIPLSVDSESRKSIIFDFFDLLAAIAANGKSNGLGGRKISRLAGWWAFEQEDTGNGFEGGYKAWEAAADASSHLFFAYLRSLAPDIAAGSGGISQLPRSLQALLADTEYPPEPPSLLQALTPKVLMIVDHVSPTPYSLLRRAKHFEYRDEDSTLQSFSEYEDPVRALTSECRRVLDCIASTNQSAAANSSSTATPAADSSWSRFADIGFDSLLENNGAGSQAPSRAPQGLRATASSGKDDLGRPTTPSWADFLSSGFSDDGSQKGPPGLHMPTKQILPPLSPPRVQSSQSHMRNGVPDDDLEPGELTSITRIDLDETFWWVWMTSLAGEEPPARKAVFGRCAFIETEIRGGRWVVMEERIKGAIAAQPDQGAYIVEKKRRFPFSRRTRERRSSTGRKPPQAKNNAAKAASTPALQKHAPSADQEAKVQAAARELVHQQQHGNRKDEEAQAPVRRGRFGETADSKANSVMTLGLQPTLKTEAAPAIEWARKFDKDTIRARYLGDPQAGAGTSRAPTPSVASTMDFISAMKAVDNPQRDSSRERELPRTPQDEVSQEPFQDVGDDSKTLRQALQLQPPSIPQTTVTGPEEFEKATPHKHQHKESEKTMVSAESQNQSTRKPIDSFDKEVGDHPAFRQDEQENRPPESGDAKVASKPPPAAAAAAAAMKNSNENKASAFENVQKSKVGSTRKFRNIFSRKKPEGKPTAEEPEALAMHRQISTQGSRGSKERSSQSSTLRKPAPPQHAPPPVPVQESEQVAPTHERASSSAIDEGEPGPQEETIGQERDPSGGQGQNDAHEMHSAHPDHGSERFSDFTQGSLEEQPAFSHDQAVPSTPRQDSPVSRPSYSSTQRGPAQTGSAISQDETERPSGDGELPRQSSKGFDPRVDRQPDSSAVHNEQSDQTAAGTHEATSTDGKAGSDRWAQIRKNAADRRATEEQSAREEQTSRASQNARTEKTDKTNTSETSGEESIEDRVARIRARVAQLTGGQNDESANGAAH